MKKDFEIQTERLFLRTIQMKDAETIFQIVQEHPEITEFMGWYPPKKIEDTQKYIQKVTDQFPAPSVVWSIFYKGEFAGVIGYEDLERKYNEVRIDCAEIGYWLSPKFHRKGFMTEAARAVLAFGFETLKLHRVIVKHVVENGASRRVIEKLGFRFVGVLEKEFEKNGKWHNVALHEMLEEKFQQ